MKVIGERFSERGKLVIGRVLVVSGSPCSSCCGGRGGERDLGNEVVVKRDGTIMGKKLCRGEKWGINHSQAFGSWKNDE